MSTKPWFTPPTDAPPPRKRGTSRCGLAVLIAGAVLAAAVVGVNWDLLAPGKRPPRLLCLSNLRRLAFATLMYASDHADVLPGRDNWEDTMRPYLKLREVLTCPATRLSYEYSPVLDARPLEDVPEPDRSIMLWESGFPRGPAPHDGKWNVAFVDGHARTVSSSDARRYRMTF